MKKKPLKIIIIILAVLLIIAGICFGIRASLHSKAVDVYSVATMSDIPYEEGSTFNANISDGEVQNVLLRDGLVENINVKVGDMVKKGDVLMKYDQTSYDLILQKDEADISVTESNIKLKEQEINRLRTLKPSEQAPEATEEIIDHGELKIFSELKDSDINPDINDYNVTPGSVLSSGFLKALRDSSKNVVLNIYENETLYGTLTLDGSLFPSEEYAYTAVDQSIPEESRKYTRTVIDPLDNNIALADGFSVENETLSVRFEKLSKINGSFTPLIPSKYERYETILHYPDVPEGSEDYIYSSAELTAMIKAAETELKSLDMNLKSLKITYEKDKLNGTDGSITATIDGEVTEVKSAAECELGETLISVKGEGSYQVIAYVSELSLPSINIGDPLSVMTYSTGSNLTAEITEIGTSPSENMYYGSNPNSSFYPITAKVTEWDIDPQIGDWGEARLVSQNETTDGGFCIPLMYVRNDEKGRYVYLRNEKEKLEKRYVETGKIYWGYEIRIKKGLTTEDYIAFPYGKNVKNGVSTNISDEWL